MLLADAYAALNSPERLSAILEETLVVLVGVMRPPSAVEVLVLTVGAVEDFLHSSVLT